jgi:hypothetical protein
MNIFTLGVLLFYLKFESFPFPISANQEKDPFYKLIIEKNYDMYINNHPKIKVLETKEMDLSFIELCF